MQYAGVKDFPLHAGIMQVSSITDWWLPGEMFFKTAWKWPTKRRLSLHLPADTVYVVCAVRLTDLLKA